MSIVVRHEFIFNIIITKIVEFIAHTHSSSLPAPQELQPPAPASLPFAASSNREKRHQHSDASASTLAAAAAAETEAETTTAAAAETEAETTTAAAAETETAEVPAGTAPLSINSLLDLVRVHNSVAAECSSSSADWSLPRSLDIAIDALGVRLCALHPLLPQAIVATAVEVARSSEGREALRLHAATAGSSFVTLCINAITHSLTRTNDSGIALSVNESDLVMQLCRFLRLMMISETISCSLVEDEEKEEQIVNLLLRVVDLFLDQQHNIPADDSHRLAVTNECIACLRSCISLLPVSLAVTLSHSIFSIVLPS